MTPVDADHGGSAIVLGAAMLRRPADGHPGTVGTEVGFTPPDAPGVLLAPDVSFYREGVLPPRGQRRGS